MLRELPIFVPTFEILKSNEDGTVRVRYTNTNHFVQEEDVPVERLTSWLNHDIRVAWYDGYKVAKMEIKKALEI